MISNDGRDCHAQDGEYNHIINRHAWNKNKRWEGVIKENRSGRIQKIHEGVSGTIASYVDTLYFTENTLKIIEK